MSDHIKLYVSALAFLDGSLVPIVGGGLASP